MLGEAVSRLRQAAALLEARASEYGGKSVFRFLDSGADWSYVDLEPGVWTRYRITVEGRQKWFGQDFATMFPAQYP